MMADDPFSITTCLLSRGIDPAYSKIRSLKLCDLRGDMRRATELGDYMSHYLMQIYKREDVDNQDAKIYRHNTVSSRFSASQFSTHGSKASFACSA